jgi:hypothetical protein
MKSYCAERNRYIFSNGQAVAEPVEVHGHFSLSELDVNNKIRKYKKKYSNVQALYSEKRKEEMGTILV